jgi:putative flippase GtrA
LRVQSEVWRRLPWLGRLLRFGFTGLIATGIHVLVAVTLIARLHTLPYIANPIAFVTATGFSYAANTLWSFSSRMNHRTLRRYACGCAATAAVAGAAAAAGLDYRIGILLVIALVTPLTFGLHSRWTYRAVR